MSTQHLHRENNNRSELMRISGEMARMDYLKETMNSQREQLAGVLYVAEESKRKLLELLQSME